MWVEGTQSVRRRGMVIVTTKPAGMRLPYGNDRVRELREQRGRLDDGAAGRLRRFVSWLAPSGTADSGPAADGALPGAPDRAAACVAGPALATDARARIGAPKRPSDLHCPLLRKIGACWKTILQQRHTLGEDHPLTAITMHRMACLCRDAERFDEASKWFLAAHYIWTKQLGPDHPSVAQNFREWAQLMRMLGSDAEAARLQSRAEAIQRQVQVA